MKFSKYYIKFLITLIIINSIPQIQSQQIEVLKTNVSNNENTYLYFIPKNSLYTCVKDKLSFYKDIVNGYNLNYQSIGILCNLEEKDSLLVDYLKSILPFNNLIIDYDNTITNQYNITKLPSVILIDSKFQKIKSDLGLNFSLDKDPTFSASLIYLKENFPLLNIMDNLKVSKKLYILDNYTNTILELNLENFTINAKLKMNENIYNTFLKSNKDFNLNLDTMENEIFNQYVRNKSHIQSFENLLFKDKLFISTKLTTNLLKYKINGDSLYSYSLQNKSVLLNIENFEVNTLNFGEDKNVIKLTNLDNDYIGILVDQKGLKDSIIKFNLQSDKPVNIKKYRKDILLNVNSNSRFENIFNTIYYISLNENKIFVLDTNFQITNDFSYLVKNMKNQLNLFENDFYFSNMLKKENKIYTVFNLKNKLTLDNQWMLLCLDLENEILTIIDKKIPKYYDSLLEIKLVDKLDDGRFEFIIKLEKSRWAMLYL